MPSFCSVWCMNIREIPPDMEADLISSLPPLRQDKILSLREKRKRLQSLAAGLLSRHLLGRMGISDSLLQYEENGKPLIQNHPEWYLSLSHSGEFAVCALSLSPVAVDIQRHDGVLESILRTGYTEAERVFCETATDRERAFYDIWCRKECKAKLRPYPHLREIDALTVEQGFQYQDFAMPGYSCTIYRESA